MQLANGQNTIDERRFSIVEERLLDRHFYEYEEVHNGSGRSDEMPSQMEARHNRERKGLEAMRRTSSIVQWIFHFPYAR
jgi:hypothetical protein